MENLIIDDTIYKTQFTEKYINRKKYKVKNLGEIKAFIPGLIIDILVKEGDEVEANQSLLILEAMKTHNVLYSEINGIVEKVLIIKDEKVKKDQILIMIK